MNLAENKFFWHSISTNPNSTHKNSFLSHSSFLFLFYRTLGGKLYPFLVITTYCCLQRNFRNVKNIFIFSIFSVLDKNNEKTENEYKVRYKKENINLCERKHHYFPFFRFMRYPSNRVYFTILKQGVKFFEMIKKNL